jgi:phospholipid/cholesterol/gamma-HCH transport system ATP-binding protein
MSAGPPIPPSDRPTLRADRPVTGIGSSTVELEPPILHADQPILRIDGLTVAYDERFVLQDVSFDVARGEIVVVLGGSGSGKSTLLKHVIGLRRPLAGRVLVDGEDLLGSFGRARLAILRKIGVGYQSGALFGSMTLIDNVALPLEEFTDLPPRAIELAARMKLKLVGLEDAADKMPDELSGGMQKRGAIARAMALDPKILFLDEPSAGLDPITSAELDQLILRLRDTLGTTFVVVSHELASIEAIADRAVMLDGKIKGIRAIGRPADLRDHADPEVARFFRREVAPTSA